MKDDDRESCVLCYRRSRHISIAGLCPECVAELESDDDDDDDDDHDDWYRREVVGMRPDEQF